ncbi:MAG: M48 family metalloprotease [Desulfobulbaceae bacterium]|nr:M48 family metalloprotease [Desulfobulbaceae bacterium]
MPKKYVITNNIRRLRFFASEMTQQVLAEKAGVELKQYKHEKEQATDKNKILEILELAVKFYETQLWKGVGKDNIMAYLRERGLTDESIQNFRLGYAPNGWDNISKFLLGRGFTLDEIETVLAHELGHHVHKDIPFLIAFGTLSTTLSLFIASLALDSAVGFFSFTSAADIAAFPALMLILSAYGLLTLPLDNAISRWRENMADDYALQSTGKNEAFASAFTRLANQNLGEIDPEAWVVFMFYSHPPLGERIEKAKKFITT